MKINCLCCKGEISLNDKVVIDVVNSIYHTNCYGEFSNSLIDWKDFGTFKNIVEKHDFFSSNS